MLEGYVLHSVDYVVDTFVNNEGIDTMRRGNHSFADKATCSRQLNGRSRGVMK